MHGYACHYRLIRISLTFWIALGLSACGSFFAPEPTSTPPATFTPEPPTATPVPMALTVNGEGIPVEDFNAQVQRYLTSQTSLGKTVSAEEAADAVKEDLTAQLLLAQAARVEGFSLDEAGLQARLESLSAQVGGANALSAWESAHGYTDQAFRSELQRAAEAAFKNIAKKRFSLFISISLIKRLRVSDKKFRGEYTITSTIRQDRHSQAGKTSRHEVVASPRVTPSMRTKAASIKNGAISMITL